MLSVTLEEAMKDRTWHCICVRAVYAGWLDHESRCFFSQVLLSSVKQLVSGVHTVAGKKARRQVA